MCKDLSKIHEYTSNADSSNLFLQETQSTGQDTKHQRNSTEPGQYQQVSQFNTVNEQVHVQNQVVVLSPGDELKHDLQGGA